MKNKLITHFFMPVMLMAFILVTTTDRVCASDINESDEYAYFPEISEDEKSTDEADNQAPFIYKELSDLSDGFLITVTGNMPEGAYISVKHIENKADKAKETEEIINDSFYYSDDNSYFTVCEMFDIDIYDEDDNKWQPCDFDETLTVTIDSVKLPVKTSEISEEYGVFEENTALVYRVEDDDIDLMDAEIKKNSGEIGFETDHFTLYVIGSKTVTSYMDAYDIGYPDEEDVKAYFIENEDDNEKYDCIMIGTGDTKDFNSLEELPWIDKYAENVANIYIEDGITSLGDYILLAFTEYEDMEIPESITSFGNNLEESKMYAAETLIASYPIGNSSGNYDNANSDQTPDDNVMAYLYSNGDGLTYTLKVLGSGKMAGYSYASYIPWYDDYAENITVLEIGDGITGISRYIFEFLAITSIKLPSTIEEIKCGAFMYCNNLSQIDISDVTCENVKVEADVFKRSINPILDTQITGLTSSQLGFITYDWGGSKRNIDMSSYYGTFTYKGRTYDIADATASDNKDMYFFEDTGLLYMPVNSSIPYASDSDETLFPPGALNNVKIIYFPDYKTVVPARLSYCFSSLKESLEEVRLADADVTVESLAFAECKNLRVIDISKIKNFGFGCFQYCNKLTELEFSEGIESMESYAFYTGSTNMVPTYFSGCVNQLSVLSYRWVYSNRLLQPKYRVYSVDNEDLLIEENFSDDTKISSVDLKGYTGNLYVDRECTESVTFPYYSLSDVDFYLDIESGTVFSGVELLCNPTDVTELPVYDASDYSSIVKYRDGFNAPIIWYDDITPTFNVDLTGLKLNITTSTYDKNTSEYATQTLTSENGESVGGFEITPVRLYNDIFEFDTDISYAGERKGFSLHYSGEALEKEKENVIPGNSLSMNCELLISKDGYKKYLTVPITLSVVAKDLPYVAGDRVNITGKVDYGNYPETYPKDTEVEIYYSGSVSDNSMLIGVMKYESYDVYRCENPGSYNKTYCLIGDDVRLIAGDEYHMSPNPGSYEKDLCINGSYTNITPFFSIPSSTASSGSSNTNDYRIDVYFDLREYGGGFRLVNPVVIETGGFYMPTLEMLGLDTRKYGSATFRLYGVTIPYTIDETFDYSELADAGGLYTYSLTYAEESRVYTVNHKWSCDSYYTDNKFYVCVAKPILSETLESTYTVKLPASVELTKESIGASGTFNVYAKGKLAKLNTLHVFLDNPETNKLIGLNTNTQIPFLVSRTKGDDYFYCDTIEENYQAQGNEYTVSVLESDLSNAPMDTYTGNITVEYRIEPRF